MPWSSPIPQTDLAGSLAIGRLLGPIAVIAITSVLTGFGVILAGILEQVRNERLLRCTRGAEGEAARAGRRAPRAA